MVSSSITSGKKLAKMLPFSQPAAEVRSPTTPNTAAAVASERTNWSSDVESLKAGYSATTTSE